MKFYLKDAVDLPLVLHTHSTTGLGFMTLLKAVEAGCDVVDTAISSMSGGTSQPATETLNYTLAELGYETGLDNETLRDIADFFKPIRAKALESGLLNPTVLTTDTKALDYQVPGGMLSNLVAQLTAQGKMDKFDEVLLETPRVREDLGFPPLVTPTSQIVGTQAVNNVLFANEGRYARVTKEFKGLVRGEYGSTPVPMDPEFVKKIIGSEQPITHRPADDLKPELEQLRAEIAQYLEQDEDVLSYALFPEVSKKFFEFRKAKKYGLDADHADSKLGVHAI